MGMSDKKTTTQQQTQQQGNTAFSQTTTPNVPTWISDPAQAMAGQVGALTAQGPNAFMPTTSALENQTTQAAANFSPTNDLTSAGAAYSGVPDVQGQSLLTGLDQYMSPYLSDVVNSTLGDYDVQAGKTRAAQAAAAAQGGAFQGSRYGVQEAATEGELARGRAATESGLLNQGFTTAAGLSAQDAAARQAAQTANQQAALAKAQGLLGVGTAQNAEQLAALGVQTQAGQRATEEQQMQQQYPLTFGLQTEGLLSGLNPALFTGSSSSGTGDSSSSGTMSGTQSVSDPIGNISKLMAAASAFLPKPG